MYVFPKKPYRLVTYVLPKGATSDNPSRYNCSQGVRQFGSLEDLITAARQVRESHEALLWSCLGFQYTSGRWSRIEVLQ
jgi:hypothetical protein